MKIRRIPMLRVEVDGLIALLQQGVLAASPFAAIFADPFAYGASPEDCNQAVFAFSDIPDLQFREPRDIFMMSHSEGGSKS